MDQLHLVHRTQEQIAVLAASNAEEFLLRLEMVSSKAETWADP